MLLPLATTLLSTVVLVIDLDKRYQESNFPSIAYLFPLVVLNISKLVLVRHTSVFIWCLFHKTNISEAWGVGVGYAGCP